MKTDEQINEAFFMALGWEKVSFVDYKGVYWKPPGVMLCDNIPLKHNTPPNPCQDYPDFKKFVLDMMEAEGWDLTSNGRFIQWMPTKNQRIKDLHEEIINGEILTAGVIAATQYLLEKK